MGSGTRRRREGAVECLLCGSQMQCYRGEKSASMVLVLRRWNGLWKFGEETLVPRGLRTSTPHSGNPTYQDLARLQM
jgi:hypothetical protein